MVKINTRALPIYLAFIIELLSLSVCKNVLPAKLNPLITTAASLFIVWYAYKLWINNEESETVVSIGISKTILKTGSVLLAVVTGIYFASFFASEPIDINKSDIIPIIQEFYVERLFKGEFVYAAVDRGTYFWTPNYFPMHWLPFCISFLLNIDHRLLALSVLLAVVCYYSFKTIDREEITINAALKILLPYSILFCMRLDHRIILGHTVETMICGYYLLFAFTIIRGNTILKSLGLSSILLSRFSIVLWTPFYIISSFFNNKKETIRLSIYCLLFALVVFIIPFISRDPSLLLNGFNAFTEVYLLEWRGQSWQPPGSNPCQLYDGVGFACYYHAFWPGTLLEKLKAIVATQMVLNILVPVLGFIMIKKWSAKIGVERYQLLSLKVCLLVFYSFIVVPYQYLFMVPLFISVVIVSRFNMLKKG
jgi:hypothetical protein